MVDPYAVALRGIEQDQFSAFDVGGRDRDPRFARIESAEIDQAFESGTQRLKIIETAEGLPRQAYAGMKLACTADQSGTDGVRPILGVVPGVATDVRQAAAMAHPRSKVLEDDP